MYYSAGIVLKELSISLFVEYSVAAVLANDASQLVQVHILATVTAYVRGLGPIVYHSVLLPAIVVIICHCKVIIIDIVSAACCRVRRVHFILYY
jgi:hypothetical protein